MPILSAVNMIVMSRHVFTTILSSSCHHAPGLTATRDAAAASATFATRSAHVTRFAVVGCNARRGSGSLQPASYDIYACGCGNGISQKLLASTRSGRFDLAL